MNKETKKGKGEPKFAAAAAAAAADVILEAMIDGVAIADMNGTVIQCNSGWVKMFGYKSTEEARGRNITEIIIERDIPRCMEGFKDCLEKGIAAINFEFTAKDRSGREFPVMLNAVALRDEKGNVVGNVGTLRDITEFKKIQEELQKRINELEEFGKIAVERELDMKKLEEELEKLRGKK